MVESVRQEFELYRKQGIVDQLIVQNAGTDTNTQIAQIRNLIASDIDLLLILPNSATALNPVIEEAQEAGILTIVYEMPIDNPNVLNMFIDQNDWFGKIIAWLFKELDYKGDIVYLTGIPDQPISITRDKLLEKELQKNPNIKLLAMAPSYWTSPTAQQAMTDILASFPKIDGVLLQDGYTIGVIRAFQAAKRPLPIITGDHQIEFIRLWKELKDKVGFRSYMPTNPPGEAVNDALGVGIRLLQGKKLKPNVLLGNGSDKIVGGKGNMIHIPIKLELDNSNIDKIYEEYKDWADTYFVNHWMTQQDIDALFE